MLQIHLEQETEGPGCMVSLFNGEVHKYHKQIEKSRVDALRLIERLINDEIIQELEKLKSVFKEAV